MGKRVREAFIKGWAAFEQALKEGRAHLPVHAKTVEQAYLIAKKQYYEEVIKVEEIGRAALRLWRVGVAGFLSAVAINAVDLNFWWIVPITAAVNGLWKFLRQKYPDYWLWKLM